MVSPRAKRESGRQRGRGRLGAGRSGGGGSGAGQDRQECATLEGKQGGHWLLAEETWGAARSWLLCFHDARVEQKATSHLYRAGRPTPRPEAQNQHGPVNEETQLQQAG